MPKELVKKPDGALIQCKYLKGAFLLQDETRLEFSDREEKHTFAKENF